MNTKFIELTFNGEIVGLINVDHIVSITHIENVGVAFTLTQGNPVYTDMPYNDIKNWLGITSKSSDDVGVTYS